MPTHEADDYDSDAECIERESNRMLADLKQSILKFASSETPSKLVNNLTDDL